MNVRFATRAAVLGLILLTGCSVELHHGLPEQDANDIYVLLNENGIPATKTREEGGNTPTYMISVPKADAPTASRLLKEYSLPRPSITGLQVFADKKGMIPTQTEERAMFLEALGGEVSLALNKIDGVLEARTIVMIPEQNDLTQPDQKPQPSASVLVKYRPLADGKAPLSEAEVRKFVATAVPDMKPENVTVLMSQALPPTAVVTPESQLKDVFGIKMTASSVGTFRAVLGGLGLVILLMFGYIVYSVMRGGGSSQPSRPRPRPRPEA